MKYISSVKNILLVWIGIIIGLTHAFTQNQTSFTRADTLRGQLSPLRSCYDVTFYDLEVQVSPELKRIAGSNKIRFKAINYFDVLQIDLFANMRIARIVYRGRSLEFWREHNAVFVRFPSTIAPDTEHEFTVFYGGTPRVAEKPPWDGGFIWERDAFNRHLISVACEGIGASLWWPLKDHLSDEPDSMRISVIIPDMTLMAISNGVLRDFEKRPGGFAKYVWYVDNPINSYNVTLYIGSYLQIREYYENVSGKYPLDYYVLSYHESKAKEHFKQVPGMIECYEKYFGEYPFWNDGYGIVETSYWGMEHQGAIAYGNHYQNNDFGFDFIVIHESAHEWFGNSISVADHAEMWIHEAFTTYAEAIYLECSRDYEQSIKYLNTQKDKIANQVPMLGPLDVNYDDWPAADIYYKGTWMLHTLRNVVNDDDRWFACLKNFATMHRHSIVNTEQVISFFNRQLLSDYTYLFNQYLRHTAIPTLEYSFRKEKGGTTIRYRWNADETDFRMPLDIFVKGTKKRIEPSIDWKEDNFKECRPEEIGFYTDGFLINLKQISD